MVHCHKCGKELNEHDDFCSKCGAEIKSKKEHVKEEHQHKEEKKKPINKGVWVLISFALIIGIMALGIEYGLTNTSRESQKDSQTQTSAITSGQYLPVGTKGALNDPNGGSVVIFTDESSLNEVIDYIYTNDSESLKKLTNTLVSTGKIFKVNTGTKAEIVNAKTGNKGFVIYQIKLLESASSATFWVLYSFFVESPSQKENVADLTISINDLYRTFASSSLSDIQKKDKYEREFKGKIINITIKADLVNQATLSSQYVVIQNDGMITSCVAKAFFPKEEKDKLLRLNIGDAVTFTGKLVNYDFGLTSCLEFSDAKVVKIHNN